MKTLFGAGTLRCWLLALPLVTSLVLVQTGHGYADQLEEENRARPEVEQGIGFAEVATPPDTKVSVPVDYSTPIEEASGAQPEVEQVVGLAEDATPPDAEVSVAADYTTPMGALENAQTASTGDDFDSDPWESFNDKMFWFNREVLDRFLLKPLATAWDFIFPDAVQRGFHNMFDNLAVVRRVVNNSLQAKFIGAATELARFTINSTVGLVGFFDVAKDGFGIEQRDEDLGQTFGLWGMGPGPYLVLPFLPPLSVRDGIGYALDAAMTPYTYFIPWYASLGGTATSIVNERSLNLDRFERVAESTVDLYSAVRNAYLQRRAAAIRQ